MDKVYVHFSLGPLQAVPSIVLSIYQYNKDSIRAWLSTQIWGLTLKLHGWMSSTCSVLCLSPYPFASLSGQPLANACSEVQRIVLSPLFSFSFPKLTWHTKPEDCCGTRIPISTIIQFSPPFSSPADCLDRWSAFPLNTFSLRQLWKSFFIVSSLDDYFASFLFMVWFVPFLKLSDLWKSTSIHEEFHVLVKLNLKLYKHWQVHQAKS